MDDATNERSDGPPRSRKPVAKGINSRNRLLDAAEILFGNRGYDAVSVRDITRHVGANVASVRYYFGSKEALFGEVLERRLEPINAARRARLLALTSKKGANPVSVEQLLGAVIEPLVEHIRDSPSSASWLKLVGRSRIESGSQWWRTQDLHRQTFTAFVNAFARALPQITKKEIAQRLFWVSGAVANSLIDTRDLKRLGFQLQTVTERPDTILPMMIKFYTGAMKAPPTRQPRRSHRKAKR